MTDPIGERTVTLGDELDRLDQRADDLAAKVNDADGGTQSGQAFQQMLNEVDQQGAGVAYLVEEYGTDATVTVRGMDAGGYAQVEDRIADVRARTDDLGGNPGTSRTVWAASGLVDAPFVEIDAESDLTEYEQRLAAVTDQPVGVAKWLESLVNEETSVEGNWKSSTERLAAISED